MTTLSPFLLIHSPCEQALVTIKKKLDQAGLRSVQTFDLHAARAGSHDCQCPNHGTEHCDCQMVVLLIYGRVEEPVSLILHGNDGQTWLSLIDTFSPASQTLANTIRQAL